MITFDFDKSHPDSLTAMIARIESKLVTLDKMAADVDQLSIDIKSLNNAITPALTNPKQ